MQIIIVPRYISGKVVKFSGFYGWIPDLPSPNLNIGLIQFYLFHSVRVAVAIKGNFFLNICQVDREHKIREN